MSILPTRNSMVPLLCGILLLLRIGGAHLHLCFDGQEPPVTAHLLDGGVEHLHGSTTHEHQDENIDDGSASLVKKSTVDVDLLPLLFAALVLWIVLPRPGMPRFRGNLLPAFHVSSHLRPPLRGPPATTFT